MTVCRYYLQGTCRFGDRCRFEHVDPDRSSNSNSNYSNRRNDYGYQDRYRYQENYQDRSNKYDNQELSFGPRRYDKQNQNSRSEKYGQYDNYNSYSNVGQSHRDNSYDKNYYKDDYSRYSSNQRYSSPERQSSNSRSNFNQSYDNSYNQKNYNTYSTNQRYSSPERQGSRYDSSFQKSNYKPNVYSQYDKSQYEWVSNDYKPRTQHQKKELSSPDTSQYQSSSKSFSFKNLDGDKSEDINEENMILAERIKDDAIAWELGNQWPFTCYSPLPKKGEFPGFSDISFEELRYEALKAEESNSFDNFVQNITQALLNIQNRRNKLKQPTENLLSMIEKLRAGEYLSKAFETRVEVPVMNFPPSVEEDIADETPLNTQSSMPASSFSFKTTLDKGSHVTNSASSSFSFKSILDPTSTQQSMQSSSVSSFSFKVPETDKPSISMLSSKETDEDYPMYTPIKNLSEQDREQFTASTFTLGKIPTVPPPKVLCF